MKLTPRETAITIRGLHKAFGGQPVYSGFDLDVKRGDILAIFGPNGCGKSTLINMAAGLLPRDGGDILFDGREVAEIRVGYVFQNYREALFPWRRAADNIRYPMRRMGLPAAQVEARLQSLAERFRVRFDLNRYPYELSGGQQQLVSIMRALAVEPEVLFLDEPFSALDFETTLSLRDLLQRVLKDLGITTILVSHDLRPRVLGVLAKGEPEKSGAIRGSRHTMLGDTDLDAQRHLRGALGAIVASVAGHGQVFVSGGAEHQGPPGGGLVCVFARAG